MSTYKMCVRLLCFCGPQSTIVIAVTLHLTRAKKVLKKRGHRHVSSSLGRIKEENHEDEVKPSCK